MLEMHVAFGEHDAPGHDRAAHLYDMREDGVWIFAPKRLRSRRHVARFVQDPGCIGEESAVQVPDLVAVERVQLVAGHVESASGLVQSANGAAAGSGEEGAEAWMVDQKDFAEQGMKRVYCFANLYKGR